MRSSLRFARLALVLTSMIVGCQQADDPTLSLNSGTKNPVLIRAADGSLYSSACIKVRGLRALATCGVTRGVRAGRGVTVVPDTSSTTGVNTVYSPTNYQQNQFCPALTGSASCYSSLGYSTSSSGTATFQGSTEQGSTTQGSMCSVCMDNGTGGGMGGTGSMGGMGGVGTNCMQRSCFWMIPGFTDTTGSQVYNVGTGSFSVGSTGSSSIMGNWTSTSGSGTINFAAGTYTRTMNTGVASESGSYTSDGTNVAFTPSNAAPYSCTASYPTASQLSLMCYQNGITQSYFYNRY